MMSPQPTNFLRTAYDRCDALLHLAEDEDSLLVAANETGREVFERLFVLPVDWEKDWSRLALPADWKAIGISVGGILIGGGPRFAQGTAQEPTLDRDCPSSDDLRPIRHFAKGGSDSSGVRV